jgi:hypothetical protein
VEARTPAGLVLHLRTTARLAPEDPLTVTAHAAHLLVYPAGGAG